MTPCQNFTLNCDPYPGSQFNVESRLGSKFNVELRPWVIIQRWIKIQGHNSTRGPNFIRRRGRYTMTPCLRRSKFDMKNPLNPEHNPLNQGPKGRNSMGSKFNPTHGDNLCRYTCFLSIAIVAKGGVVFECLSCGARGPGFDFRSRHLNFRDLECPSFKSRYTCN